MWQEKRVSSHDKSQLHKLHYRTGIGCAMRKMHAGNLFRRLGILLVFGLHIGETFDVSCWILTWWCQIWSRSVQGCGIWAKRRLKLGNFCHVFAPYWPILSRSQLNFETICIQFSRPRFYRVSPCRIDLFDWSWWNMAWRCTHALWFADLLPE